MSKYLKTEYKNNEFIKDYSNNLLDEDRLNLYNLNIFIIDLLWNKNTSTQLIFSKYKKTPPKILNKLAINGEHFIKANVAKNKNTTPKTLLELTNFNQIFINKTLLTNPNTPRKAIKNIYEQHISELANNFKINPYITNLINDILKHKNCPVTIFKKYNNIR